MRALIIGATGATGKDLVDILLRDPDYTDVVIFVRRASGVVHPKLTEILTDFEKMEPIEGQIKGDVWFSCLGTTLKTAGSKDKQWHIDYEIPLEFARVARRNGVAQAVLLSAYGASPRSNVFYSKMKGELEEKIKGLVFEKLIIFKPGLLLRKDTDRLGERISASAIRLLNRLGIMKKFRPMPTEILAEKLAKVHKVCSNGTHVIELDGIFEV
ncbi:MAG: NAD(P)H-binding protein [Dyadobacter sp.]|uniref:NAD(P)H-binding protein n=1 Tax=Dyadobacter sp. TaxID=1914288 RepID=UPI001B000225|nr:NAD(P)H-binding protein [Dyadobacter sp.]MBO9616984.1 NAD(P)H-binding protein [Dyadobacter sp.]